MSMFKPTSSFPQQKPTLPKPVHQHVVRGDRGMVHRQEVETIRVREQREGGRVKATAVVDRVPNGCLFKVTKKQWFDLDGFFCESRSNGVIVKRGAPRNIMKTLTAAQKRNLTNVRLMARKSGLR